MDKKEDELSGFSRSTIDVIASREHLLPKSKFTWEFTPEELRFGNRLSLTDLKGKPVPPTKIANSMILQAKEYDNYSKIMYKNMSESTYKAAIWGAIKDTITPMKSDTREAVFAELNKMSEAAKKETDEKQTWACPAGDIRKACNLLNSVKYYLEKEEQQKQQGDDGMTM